MAIAIFKGFFISSFLPMAELVPLHLVCVSPCPDAAAREVLLPVCLPLRQVSLPTVVGRMEVSLPTAVGRMAEVEQWAVAEAAAVVAAAVVVVESKVAVSAEVGVEFAAVVLAVEAAPRVVLALLRRNHWSLH
jgi:hypothetical protein